jgi:selenophosphate synthase
VKNTLAIVITGERLWLLDNFWDHIEKYRKLGFDPLKWIATCSNELDPTVFKTALNDIKRSSVKLTPSWFEQFYHIDGKSPELTRRVFSLTGPVIDKEVEVKRAVAILRIHSGIGENPQSLSDALQGFLKVFNGKLSVTCSSALLTEHPDAQFAMFDYIDLHRGDKVGYMPAVTAVTQVTDITRAPDADIHCNIAIASAIESLNLLGCGVSSAFKLFPAYDAPSEDILDRIRSNLDAITSRYNLAMEDYNSLKIGKLFYGTTAMAATTKELPIKYDQVDDGMEIIVTNKFGGLAAASLHALGRMDSENIIKYETNNVSFEAIGLARDEAIKNLSEPHFALGKIIAKYCPDYGLPFDKSSHIMAVYPVGSKGVLALGELAELSNSIILINELPVRDEEIAKFATKEFLVENATASAGGCNLIVASKDVGALIMEDLSKHNFAPMRIGSISKKGAASVVFETKESIHQYVASRKKIDQLSAAVQHPPAG